MLFEFFPIIDGMFSIAAIVIIIAFFGNILLRLFGLSGPSGSLGPASFLAGVISIGAIYLSLPKMKKAGLLPQFLSVEFFIWFFLLAFVFLPIFFIVLSFVYAVLTLMSDFIVSKLMTIKSKIKQASTTDVDQKKD